MEREAGGGIGMGNTCKSMADSCQCMAKTTTIKKKKKEKKSNSERKTQKNKKSKESCHSYTQWNITQPLKSMHFNLF